MKLLYLSLVNFEDKKNFGVRKKVEGQFKVFEKNFQKCFLAYIKNDGMYINHEQNEQKISSSKWRKFQEYEKRIIHYGRLINYIKSQNINIVYIRYHLSDPFFIWFLKKCKSNNIKVYLEIATFPYDEELGNGILTIDKFSRKQLVKYVDLVITYSDYEKILGINTVKTENGTDVLSHKIKSINVNNDSDELRLIVIANFSFWHGYDRLINGLNEYYKENVSPKVYINMVGDGKELNNLKNLVDKLNMNEYVKFLGVKTGIELDCLFDEADIAISSLGNHRKGFMKESALKNREYCSKGIPFVIASEDDSFDKSLRYVHKVSPDESYIDIKEIVDFYEDIKTENYNEILRAHAENNLTWEVKLRPVIDIIKEIK